MAPQWGLEDWATLGADAWPNLLLGNGLSVGVSSVFSYTSLYDAANLDANDEAVFTALGTRNFELVLNYLRISKIVCQQLHAGGANVVARYNAIRTKLITTVNDHHVAWNDVPAATLATVSDTLRGHERVWSTNYDLITYWAIMALDPVGDGFADAFWNNGRVFDVANTVPHDITRTRLWWPHGALHLYRMPDGTTVKRQRQNELGLGLLDLLGSAFHGVDAPLFVSEGTSADKLRSIRTSDYLSHAYTELATAGGAVVVFGQGLDPTFEQHLIDAFNRQPTRTIAYGIYAGTQAQANLEKARVTTLFPQATMRFYDSRTHPLSF